MVENGHKPQPSTVEKGASGISGGISFGGGRQGGYEVLLDGSPPPSVGELPSAETIFAQDYFVSRGDGILADLPDEAICEIAVYNASLPTGAGGVSVKPAGPKARKGNRGVIAVIKNKSTILFQLFPKSAR